MRLMSVITSSGPKMPGVDNACMNCDDALLFSGEAAALALFEVLYLRELMDAGTAFAAAVAAGCESDAETLNLPRPAQLDDMGLSTRVWSGMLLDPAVVDRNTLLAHLGLTAGVHRFIDVPGLGQIRLDEYAVEHLEEKPERWETGHVGYLPLVENSLRHPFEIWYGAGANRNQGERPNYRFLSLYQLDAAYMTHVVIYNPRRKKVVSSQRLTGWPQAMKRRSGLPIYAAYAPK
jgi:hypothetical protein